MDEEALAADLARREAQSWDAGRDRWQEIVNWHEIPPRRLQRDCWIAVRARVVWAVDGEEWIDTHAGAYTSRLGAGRGD